ncbi:MAG: Asp-tRNA(Asn)/Glu-tRNA(Gln) amidotransferase subunit GatA [Candidatus Aenigmarchaeota archaeon]|nr:Asp-tRNA(Asn)/Glu-tRNA(Gln) amidotransferase subunit GatA [Candidatus Aenigmarchaeota archaeon]
MWIKEAQELDKKYNIFITLAEKAEGKFPLAVKDNICTDGLRTTAGSKILHNYIPPFDATVVQRLKAVGAAVVGKTAMDEFGFGTFSVNCAYKVPKNPLNTDRSCGGSSGGSAAYIAASKHAKFALGQSTGGSISCPAAFCGVVGLTPTYGLVSRYGLIDYGNSLDKIGLLAKTVEDAAFALGIIAGHDPKDSTSLPLERRGYAKHCIPQDLKIGVPKEYFESVETGVEKAVWVAIKKLEAEGIEYREVSLPSTKSALFSYYIIAMCEASTNLAKYCGLRYGLSENPEGRSFNEYFSSVRTKGFGQEVKRRILMGTFARMAGYREAYYLKALKVRANVIAEFKRVLKSVDVLAAPTMPMIAPRFSEIASLTPLQHYTSDVLTVPANLAGLPQISVPCGKSEGMPVGLHFIGNHLAENKIISAGWFAEKIFGGKHG